MLKDFFSNLTAQKKNILFLIAEVIVVIAIVIGATVGVYVNVDKQASGKVDSSSSSVVSNSSTESDLTSEDDLTSDLSSTQSTIQESSETAVSQPDSVSYPVDNSQSDPSSNSSNPSSNNGGVKTTVMSWSDNQFLPNLKHQPASVMDYFVANELKPYELLFFTSLKGIVNRGQPRIYTADTDPSKGYNTWIEKLGIKFRKNSDPYTLIKKYEKEFNGIIIYDDKDKTKIHSLNLATTMAGVENALVASPDMVKELKKRNINLKVIKDLRKENFKSKWDIYEYQFEKYADKTNNRVIIGLNPEVFYGQLRDYAIAIKANVFYLDPVAPKDIKLLDKFFSRMPAGKSAYMGWWPQENDGVNFASSWGVVTIAADWCQNASVYAGDTKTVIKTQSKSVKPKLQNKIYLSLIMADGDNLQYMEGKLREIWNQPERGEFKISWTMSPPMKDIYRPVLRYYQDTQKSTDKFISGPSAYGYIYPKLWATTKSRTTNFAEFLRRTDNYYLSKLGWRTITVWNWDTGAMKEDLLKVYADNMPSLLGISQQENMDKRYKMINKKFLATQLDGSYCGEVYQMEQIVKNKVDEYNKAGGNKPVFITMQGVPWGIFGKLSTYAGIIEYAETLSGAVEVVDIEQMYQLITEYMNK